MSIYSVGAAGYPAVGYGYEYRNRTGSKTEIGGYSETVQKSEMAGGAFVLHYFDNEDGERTAGAACGKDYSISAYIPKDFDPENPVYKVKIWDKDGNVTERMVDLTKVDPENSDFIDMFAYSSYLESSGKCPGAQSAFMGSHANQYDTDGMRYDDLFDKTNWVGRLKDMMQMQYRCGNLKGYLEYKNFRDFLEEDRMNMTDSSTEQYEKMAAESASSREKAEEKKMTTYYNGVPLEERTGTDQKYTDKETGISYYVADGKYPYITGEDVEKLRKLCAETGEPFLKKMAEITGNIRHLDENTTAYIGDNGTLITSKDGRKLSLDTSALSYDMLYYMFQNPGGTKDYFNESYWSDYMKDIVPEYLTADR